MSEQEELLYEELAALEERIEILEDELTDLRALRDRVDELDARTDIMQLVEDSDDLEGRGRSIRLIQHMQRKASRQQMSRIALTRDQADEALHYPDVHRTTIYTDMERCADLIGDKQICWYQQADEGHIDEPQIVLDFEAFQDAATAGEVSSELVDASTDINGGA